MNYLLGDLFAERLGIGSQLEELSFEAGWQAQRANVDPKLGVRIHCKNRNDLGVSMKQLGDAWLLGFAARTAWMEGTMHKLVRNPAYRDEVLREMLIETMKELRPPKFELIFVAAVVERMHDKRPAVNTRDVLAELINLQTDGIIELRPDGGLQNYTLKDLLLSPPGPRGTRYMYARFLG